MYVLTLSDLNQINASKSTNKWYKKWTKYYDQIDFVFLLLKKIKVSLKSKIFCYDENWIYPSFHHKKSGHSL